MVDQAVRVRMWRPVAGVRWPGVMSMGPGVSVSVRKRLTVAMQIALDQLVRKRLLAHASRLLHELAAGGEHINAC